MFIGFYMPAVVRHSRTYNLCAFYRHITHLAPEDLALICNVDYLAPDPNGWEQPAHVQAYYDYVIPTAERIREYELHFIAPETFQKIDTDGGCVAAWKHLLTERYEPLESQLSAIISGIMQRRKVEAILAWGNTPSVKYVAGQYGLPVIHNEMGTLRHPHYVSTAYFDFSGVNADTECERRYAAFRSEWVNRPFPHLDRETLLDVVRSTPRFPEEGAQPTFAVGVPQQVTLDSNIVAYADGWDPQKLVALAIDRFGRENVLVRRHPHEPPHDFSDASLAQDTSGTAIEFLAKCNQILTINSSVGFEALLYGKQATMLGDNPFRFIARMPPEAELERCLALNFATFGYLAPYKLTHNTDYLRWRLSHPSETEIVQYHLGYWLTEKSRRLVEGLGDNAHLKIERVQWQEKQGQLEAMQFQLELHNSQLESERTQLQSQNSQLEAQKAQFESRNLQLESQQSQLETQNSQLEAQKAELESRTAGLEAQKAQLESRTVELESQNTQLESQNTQLESRTAELESQKAHLESRTGELESQQAKLEKRTAELESRKAQLESRTAGLETQKAQLESRTAGLEAQKAQLEKRTGELKAQQAQLESRTAGLESQKAQLESRTAELEAQRTQWESRTSELEAQKVQLESRTAGLEAQKAQLETRTAQLESRTAGLEAQKAQLETRTAQLESRTAQLESRTAELESQRTQLETQQSQLESACQHWKAAYQAVTHSHSWRVTAPGRQVGDWLRHVKQWTVSYWSQNGSTPGPTIADAGLYPVRDAAYYQHQHDECAAYRENNWLLENFDVVKQLPGSSIAEFGCGNGRFLEAAASHFADVYGFDWAEAPHLCDVVGRHSNVHFEKRDLVREFPKIRTHIASSADFLEHLMPSDVGRVIRQMHRSAAVNYHVIACYDDTHSHQTLMPPEEWLRLFRQCSPDYYVLRAWHRDNDPNKLVCIVTNYVFSRREHTSEPLGQRAGAAAQQVEAALNAGYARRWWHIAAPLRWLGRQARLLRDHGLLARMKALVKKIAKPVLRRCFRFVDGRPGLRRCCVFMARTVGIDARLRSIYSRLSSQRNVPAAPDPGPVHADGGEAMAPLRPLGTLTIDELLARVHAELATAHEEGRQQSWRNTPQNVSHSMSGNGSPC
jgi:peptidoglycan hydrolase CwlO-like protein